MSSENELNGLTCTTCPCKSFYESRIQKGGGCGMSVYCLFYFITSFNFIFSFLLFRWRSYFKGKAVGKERFQ